MKDVQLEEKVMAERLEFTRLHKIEADKPEVRSDKIKKMLDELEFYKNENAKMKELIDGNIKTVVEAINGNKKLYALFKKCKDILKEMKNIDNNINYLENVRKDLENKIIENENS